VEKLGDDETSGDSEATSPDFEVVKDLSRRLGNLKARQPEHDADLGKLKDRIGLTNERKEEVQAVLEELIGRNKDIRSSVKGGYKWKEDSDRKLKEWEEHREILGKQIDLLKSLLAFVGEEKEEDERE
jgi:chromosome segregation ATPase